MDLSRERLIAASDRNCIEFFQHYGYGPGCELHDDGDLAWFVTGIPHPLFNGVMDTRLAPEDVDRRIDDMIAEFRARHLELEWTTGATTRPEELGPRLEARGFEHTLDVPAMAVDLMTVPDLHAPKGLTIDTVRQRGDLETCLRIGLGTFEIPTAFAPRLLEIEEGLPAEQKARTRHFLGRLDGRAVATSELYIGAGVAGLYFVGTLEAARRRGLGKAMTLAALHGARDMGFRAGVLQATSMGASVYRSIGFAELYPMGIYLRPWDRAERKA